MVRRQEIIYGIIAGVVVSGMLLLFISDATVMAKHGETIGYASMVIAFSTIFFAVKEYSKQHAPVSFKAALIIGLKITIIATVIYTITWFILTNTVAKDFMEIHYQKSVDQLRNSDLPKEELDAKMAQMVSAKRRLQNPLVKIGVTISEIFPVGLVISLITAFMFKTKKT